MNVLRSAPAVLLAPESYLRAMFVLTGAALGARDRVQAVITAFESGFIR